MQYCTACRLVTPKQVVSGRLEVLSSADRRSCLHFAGEPVPEDADGEAVESAATASKVRLRGLEPCSTSSARRSSAIISKLWTACIVRHRKADICISLCSAWQSRVEA